MSRFLGLEQSSSFDPCGRDECKQSLFVSHRQRQVAALAQCFPVDLSRSTGLKQHWSALELLGETCILRIEEPPILSLFAVRLRTQSDPQPLRLPSARGCGVTWDNAARLGLNRSGASRSNKVPSRLA